VPYVAGVNASQVKEARIVCGLAGDAIARADVGELPAEEMNLPSKNFLPTT
jgi:hypothetical protein